MTVSALPDQDSRKFSFAFNRLFAKFLLVLVPVFLALEIPGFYFLTQYETRDHEEALASRVGNHAARIATALAAHDTSGNPRLAHDFLASLAADRAFLCAELRSHTGDRVLAAAPSNVGCSGRNSGHQFALAVGEDSARTLLVQFTSSEIAESHSLRRSLTLAVVIFGFIVAAIAAAFGFHLIVNRPLGNLLTAIRTNAESGERTTIDASSHDELGAVTKAFNNMLKLESRREQELGQINESLRESREEFQTLNFELEERVRIRTSELKSRETALFDSEQRFRNFAEASSDWYWEMDENLRFSYFSDRFTEVTGVDATLLLGKTREETGVPGVDLEQWQSHLDALHAHRIFRSFIHPRVKPDGNTVWLSINGIPYFDPDGNFRGYRGTGSDITFRHGHEIALQRTMDDLERRVEERTSELQESEARLQEAIETMSEGFALYDSSEHLVICNQPYRDTLPRIAALGLLTPGAKLEENIRAGIKLGFVPSAYDSGEEFLKKRLEMFRNPGGPFEYVTTNGQWIHCEERRTSNGETVAVRADITERKQAEDALRESEERLRSIVDNSPSAIFLKDLQGRYRLANKRFGEWFGMIPAEIIGKSSDDLFPENTAKRGAAQDREVIDHHKGLEWEAEVPFGDGEQRMIHFNKFPVTGINGTIIGIGVIGTDVTDRNATEEQLRQAQKMEAVGQLTGGVAHDFNNLLGVVVGNLDFLEESLGNDPEQQEMVGTALQAALQGAELTNRLLAFSRNQPLHPVIVDLNGLIHGMTGMLKRTLGETVSIRTAATADLNLVKIDPGQLESVLLNLSVNALHAMPDGGRLTIETENVELDREYTEKNTEVEPGLFAMLAVSDTGVGMSSEIIDHAFDPFFTTKEVGQGSGLGLSMAYGFVKQSGGHISIYSEVGEGTTVKLYFPAAEVEAIPDNEEPKEKAAPRGSGETVLIVEDDEGLRDLAIKTVSSLGYEVISAPDGPSALALLDDGVAVDVLFTDVVLPRGMNGIALASAALERRPRLRVLYTSGYTENAVVNNSVLDEGIELLNKPYRRGDVARHLRLVLIS